MCAGAAVQMVANGKVITGPGHAEGTFAHHEEPLPLSWEVDMIQIHPTGSPRAGGEAGGVGVQLTTEEVGWARGKGAPTHSKPEDTGTQTVWDLAAGCPDCTVLECS